jgi:hypothetical protein
MSSARSGRSKARRAQQREMLYPGSSFYIWPQMKESGWAQIPRNIGLVLAIADHVRGKDGMDVGRTYLDLLANNMGEGVVEVNNEQDFALRAGFSGGDRGVRSWVERLDVLTELGFIKVHRGPTKRIDLIILVHPRKVVKELHRRGRLTDNALWDAFRQSLADFDPENLDENEPLTPPKEEVQQQPPPPVPSSPPRVAVALVEQPRRRRRVQ